VEGLDAVEIQYCGTADSEAAQGECVSQWPPPQLQLGTSCPTVSPRAVKVILSLEGWGELVRLVEVPP
jgi:hypothetical protein